AAHRAGAARRRPAAVRRGPGPRCRRGHRAGADPGRRHARGHPHPLHGERPVAAGARRPGTTGGLRLVKYMLLIYGNEKTWSSLPPDELDRLIAETDAHNEELFRSGELVGAYGVADQVNAKVV